MKMDALSEEESAGEVCALRDHYQSSAVGGYLVNQSLKLFSVCPSVIYHSVVCYTVFVCENVGSCLCGVSEPLADLCPVGPQIFRYLLRK